MINIFHNSQDTNYRKPFGAVTVGTETALIIDAFSDANDERVQCVFLLTKTVDIDNIVKYSETVMEPKGLSGYSCSLSLNTPGVVFYRFKIVTDKGTYYYGNNDDLLGGVGNITDENNEKFYQITVTEKNLRVPEWFKKAVIYQIFPDRFAKGYDATVEDKPDSFYYGTWEDKPFYVRKDGMPDIARWDFHRGNLSGVSEKLPYIEAIGANVIYLNPIFKSRSNHRYDTCDYMHVDGLLGGDPAFELLQYVSMKDNVRLVLDGVFSHTGSDSIYFDKYGKYGTGAYKNKNSKYRSWYSFKSEDDEEYECWWGVKDLPNVNELDPDFIDYICDNEDSVVKHWIKKGASGFRLDVADELPDEFIKHINRAAREASEENGTEAVIIGEVWEDATNKVSYDKLRSYLTSKELHTVTNYPFRNNLLSFFKGEFGSSELCRRFNSLKENYPKDNFNVLVNMTGTHDVRRLMTEALDISCQNRADARKTVKKYAMAMFTFPGVPMVYYGDETCLEGETDPDNRRTYPWGHEDVNMITHFANLALLRKKNDVYTLGDTEFLKTDSENVFAFIRKYEENLSLTVITNDRKEIENVKIYGLPENIALNGENGRFESDSKGTIEIEILGGLGIFSNLYKKI